MAGIPSHEERFHNNMIDLGKLLHELISTCYDRGITIVNPVLVPMAMTYVEGMEKRKVIENFIERSKHVWDKILQRDESFFAENTQQLFMDLPNDAVKAVATLFTARDKEGKYIISEDDREAIWVFFDSFLKICIKYIHDKREPKVKTDNGVRKLMYRVRYQDKIDLLDYAKRYNLELKWPT